MDVAELNSLTRAEAGTALAACCSSGVWVDRMTAARPFSSATAILTTAEEVWWDLGADDWVEAFGAHRAPSQFGASTDYEEQFGYPYLAFSADRSTQELDALHQERLGHDPLAEMSVTAAEQARLTNLELRRLLGSV